jgi:hypothetical protein
MKTLPVYFLFINQSNSIQTMTGIVLNHVTNDALIKLNSLKMFKTKLTLINELFYVLNNSKFNKRFRFK